MLCIVFINERIAILQYMIDFGKKIFDMRISNGYNSYNSKTLECGGPIIFAV